jgi:hypothetical protein
MLGPQQLVDEEDDTKQWESNMKYHQDAQQLFDDDKQDEEQWNTC